MLMLPSSCPLYWRGLEPLEGVAMRFYLYVLQLEAVFCQFGVFRFLAYFAPCMFLFSAIKFWNIRQTSCGCVHATHPAEIRLKHRPVHLKSPNQSVENNFCALQPKRSLVMAERFPEYCAPTMMHGSASLEDTFLDTSQKDMQWKKTSSDASTRKVTMD